MYLAWLLAQCLAHSDVFQRNCDLSYAVVIAELEFELGLVQCSSYHGAYQRVVNCKRSPNIYSFKVMIFTSAFLSSLQEVWPQLPYQRAGLPLGLASPGLGLTLCLWGRCDQLRSLEGFRSAQCK